MTRITFQRSGGFAGIPISYDLDTRTLSETDADQARKLIEAANLFELPKQMKSRDVMPDRFEYKITIQDNGKRRTVVAGDQAVPANLKPLIDYLVAQAKKAE